MKFLILAALLGMCSCSGAIRGSAPLRLRGGWGGGNQQPAQDIAVHQEPAPVEQAPVAQAQPTLINHAVEYALAGSFDGIRSGVGQAVGGQLAGWVGGALQKTGSGAGMAFANLISRFPGIRRQATSPRTAEAQQGVGPQPVPTTGVCVCFITVPNETVGDTIADTLVKSGLAACVNQIPGITSTYVMDGVFQKDTELLLMVKASRDRLADIAAVINKEHPYECPEFICLDVDTGLPDYLNWVRNHGPVQG